MGQARAPRGAQGEDTVAPARLRAQEALCATGEWQQGCLVTFGHCPRSHLCSHQLAPCTGCCGHIWTAKKRCFRLPRAPQGMHYPHWLGPICRHGDSVQTWL